jgi:GT2 family glycosyltransferase
MLVHPIDRVSHRNLAVGEAAAMQDTGAEIAEITCFRVPGGPIVILLDKAAVPNHVRIADLQLRRGGQLLPAPLVKVKLPCTDETQKVIVALAATSAEAIEFVQPDEVCAAKAWPERTLPLDPGRLSEGLDQTGQSRLLRQVLESWRNLFQLGHEADYAKFCRRLLKAIAPHPVIASPEAAVTRHLAMVSAPFPEGFGDVTDVVVVGEAGIGRVAYRPLRSRRGRGYLLLDLAIAQPGSMMVVFSKSGYLVIGLEVLPRQPFLPWLQSNRNLAGEVRSFLQRSLSEALENDGSSAELLRELAVFAPSDQRNLLARKSPINAAVDLLVADGAGGVFIKGWVRDPHRLVAKASLRFGQGEVCAVDPHWLRFPRPDIDKLYKSRNAAFGFVAHLKDVGSMRGQPVVSLELGSGGTLDLLGRLASGNAADLRDAVLGGIPPERLTTDAIANIIAPAAVPLHRQYLAQRQVPDVVQLGSPVKAPQFSIIVPLYRNLDYLRFQVGAFAVDPDMARAELIFVLDSPEQRADLVHFLSGLYQLYALPMTIVVMSANFGYAAANNAGAALARGEYLVLLNSDVVPEGPGWLKRLAAPLRRGKGVVASGARLLFDDQSLQHAGMRFARDAGGHWLNLHYYKGAPRDFGPALKARKVPAVTGAALLVRREAFMAVGGFTEDYIIGDYEDSDLCLKLRAQGGEIWYCPEAVLYHFERKSINRHAGYQRSVAGLYNRWLAAQRWSDAMQDLMARFERPRHGTAS